MRSRPVHEAGFALVLAVLALALLTLLGLSLAATTSMELQVATNYRWSRQAFYNAEGGLEAGRASLRDMSWGTVLPAARGTHWWPGDPHQPPTAPFTRATRNFENGDCDAWGSGAGFGVVLDDGTSPAPWESRTHLFGRDLPGSVTLWIRRPLVQHADGSLSDDPDSDVIILTSQGVAPYAAPDGITRINAARRTLEAKLRRVPTASGWDVVTEDANQQSSVCP